MKNGEKASLRPTGGAVNLEALELRLRQLEVANEKGKSTSAILAQFYTAEYSALMARVSAWANLPYAPVPVLVSVLGLVSQIDTAVNRRMWIGVILTLIVYVAYQGTMANSLYYVLLIEKYLRPRASELVKTNEFWIHERVVRKMFPQNPSWWPYWPPIISFAFVLLVAGWSWRLDGEDWTNYVSVVVAFILSLFILVLSRSCKRLQDDIIETCMTSKMIVDEPAHTSQARTEAREEASQSSASSNREP